MQRLVASVRFDVASQVAEVSAVAELSLDGPDGFPAFDLRQPIGTALFDAAPLPPEALAHYDMGAGPEARMRVVDVACAADSAHRLDLRYRLGTPDATGARPIGWSVSGDAVTWDLWMSDLEPGRYLEMWLPAGLCHDMVAIELSVEVTGTSRPHLLICNGAVVERTPGFAWAVRYPSRFTSLSPMLTLVPADEADVVRGVADAAGKHLAVTVARLPGADADAHAACADIASWLAYFAARYGPWAHGGTYTAVLWGAPRGMEYDGATTASGTALEHEIFHSWFGRGVKPAGARDGWMDEAMATWATASRHAGGSRFGVEELGLDDEPRLLCPPHPWCRSTPREAYEAGNRLLAGVAHMAGGAGQLRSALADWHRRYSGGAASTQDLAAHLSTWCARDLGPWWQRYVHGQGR